MASNFTNHYCESHNNHYHFSTVTYLSPKPTDRRDDISARKGASYNNVPSRHTMCVLWSRKWTLRAIVNLKRCSQCHDFYHRVLSSRLFQSSGCSACIICLQTIILYRKYTFRINCTHTPYRRRNCGSSQHFTNHSIKSDLPTSWPLNSATTT